jgi:acyl-CoA thioester hydrolase
MAQVFRTTRMVEFSDTDMAGIAHFASFFRFMEAAEHAFLRSLGYSVMMQHGGEKISFPRVSASCDYLAPARFEEVLDISVAVQRLGRSSITYTIDFARGETPIARGLLTTVCCQVSPDHQIQSRPLPEALRRQLEPYVTR